MTDKSIGEVSALGALLNGSPRRFYLLTLDAEEEIPHHAASRGEIQNLSGESGIEDDSQSCVLDLDSEELRALIGEALTSGESLHNRLVRSQPPSSRHAGSVLEVSLFPVARSGNGHSQIVVAVEDATERQSAAERLAALSTVYSTVGTALDVRSTADQLALALAPGFADAASVDLLDGDLSHVTGRADPSPTGELIRVSFAPAGAETNRQHFDIRTFLLPASYLDALDDTRPRLFQASPDEPWASAVPDDFTPLITADVHSMIIAPLTSGDRVTGLLALYRYRAAPFDEADVGVVQQAASFASVHLDHARSYRREREVATVMRQRLQSGTVPDLSAVEIAHLYLPESTEGNWVDVIPLSGTRVALVIGDVTGHNIEAAATIGQLRVALHTLALQDLETDELLTHLDEVAAQLARGPAWPSTPQVATCSIAVYDPISHLCTMVRAGHHAPLIIDPDGSPLSVHVPEGPPLGVGGGRAFTPASITLPPGSLLAHYNDALLTAYNSDRAAGVRCLERILASANRPLGDLCDTVVDSMAPGLDDGAFLLLARTRTLASDRVGDWTLPADASVVSTARRLVGRQLASWNLDDAAFTSELIVSELVTNAIRYGKEPIRLRLVHDQGKLLSEVMDANSTSPHLRQARDSDEGGRGLHIVMQLSSRWGVRHSRQGKTVWSEQQLGDESRGDSLLVHAFDMSEVPSL
ncbi:ATP-binding SpoIIE family protein phosphatase [Streptomyces sp. NPDC002755]